VIRHARAGIEVALWVVIMNMTSSLSAVAFVLFSALVACSQTTSSTGDDATPPAGDDQAAGDDSTPPAAPATDAGAKTGKDSGAQSDAGTTKPPPAPACDIVGSWKGKGPTGGSCGWAGIDYSWTAQVNGYAQASWASGLTFSENYSYGAGGSLIFNSTSDDPYCGNATAQYKVTFDASCKDITFTKISDSCADRSSCLDGMALTRQ
jgi:hypothetical protein